MRPPADEQFSTSDIFSPCKILTYPEVLAAVQQDAPLRPINLEINPINICNQSCTWCTYGYLHERREVMDRATILALLLDARDIGVTSVTWTGGGEPTAYRDLADVITAAAEHGFQQGINTNGYILNPSLLELFVRAMSYVRFSVDAGTPETYARTHRVRLDAFDRVISNIAALGRRRSEAGARLTVGFSFLVDTSNVDDLLTAAKLAKSIGVDYFQIKPIVNYVESNLQFAEESTLWHHIERQMADVLSLEDDRYQVRFLGHKFHDIRLQQQYYGRTYSRCRGNELLATVGADGSVDVCCAYKGQKDWSFGNVNEKPFREIWEGTQRQQVLAQVDVTRCPPLCKAHEINKVLHYVRNFNAHRAFP